MRGGARPEAPELTIRQKLSWSVGRQPGTPIAEDRASMARSFIYLYGAGATLLALTAIFLPSDPERSLQALLAISAVAYAVVAGLLVGFDRLPLWLFKAAPAAGAVLITLAIWWGGEGAITAYAMFFFWVTMSVTYFFGLRLAISTMLFATGMYAGVLASSSEVALPLLHWVMSVGALFVAGVLVVILRQHAEEAKLEADISQANFFAQVSHELRTPLTSIIGYLDVLREDEGSERDRQEEILDVIERNSRRLHRLVGDLLFVAQTDSRVNLDLADFRVSDVAGQSVEAFSARAEREGLELRAEIEQTRVGCGDRSRIAQAIDNLVSNAIKFTERGGAVIVRARDDGDSHAIVEVEDTGMGIPPAEQQRVFERFYRTEDARTDSIEGTGLGLGIVQSIAELHGGEVSFESHEGSGSTFQVRLPLHPPKANDRYAPAR